MITVIQKPALFWSKGPWSGGLPIRNPRAGVLHRIGGRTGSVGSALNWFNDPRNRDKSSAHFIISFTGTIYQCVSIHDNAHHAGYRIRPTWSALGPGSPNLYTVGIEHEGKENDPWPEPMLLSSSMLMWWLARRFKWKINSDHLPMHRWINADKACPGNTFKYTEYLDRVSAAKAMLGDDIQDLIANIR